MIYLKFTSKMSLFVPLSPFTHLLPISYQNISPVSSLHSLVRPCHMSVTPVSLLINQELEDDEVLISFDVVSLFTSVPIDLALKVVRDRLEHDETLHERTYLDLENIISILDLCLNATYLQFQNVVYKQVHGTAMGSPVSANIVMEDIEQRALSTFRTPLRFWKRYVDDTCTAIQSCIIEEFHQHLNSIEPSIHFTYEIEQNNQLPFLDILLNRQDDGSILTSVFRKSTHNGVLAHTPRERCSE